MLLASFSGVLALATWTGNASPALIYLLTVLTATAGCVDEPARQALIPTLVPRERLPQATALSILAHNVTAVIGPALGGIAIASLGLGMTYLLDTASFGAVVVALLAMRARPEVTPPARGGLHAVLEGLRFLRRAPEVLGLMVLDFAATLFGASVVLLPVFAEEVLDVGARGLGLLASAPAAGAVAGGLALTLLPVPRYPGRWVLGGVAGYGLSVALFGAAGSFPVALLGLALAGACDTVSMTFRHTVRQLATPDPLRGRVAAVHGVFAGGGPELGNFEAGVAARLIGVQPAVVVGGLACVALAGVVALAFPRVRDFSVSEHPREAPSAVSRA